jgi:lysophospholipid acyltransferase (LPLAT)-like uncharacterized protein
MRGPTIRALRGLLGVVLGLVARLWLATLRVRVDRDPALVDSGTWVLAFWHGTQWPLLAWGRRRRTVVMVSWSTDGAMQARALAVVGLKVVRGSSSMGGARGLAAIVRALRRGGADAAFAVDGPRGPRGRAKEGAIVAARAAGALVVPMGAAVEWGTVLTGAWDRFVLAWPFSRVALRLGPPIDPADPCARTRLDAAIDQANADALALLEAGSGKLREAGDSLDLDARATGKGRSLHGRARRWILREPTRVDVVDRLKVVHVQKKDGGLDDMGERAAGGLEDGSHVVEGSLGLRGDVPLHQLSGAGVERDLSAQEDEA